MVGTLLAMMALSLPIALLMSYATAVPPLPWTFFALYGAVAVALTAVAAVQLRKDGFFSTRPPPSV